MRTNSELRRPGVRLLKKMRRGPTSPKNSGQAVVEFTLIFILLLVVTWIPADFGLGFYTGQIALNAVREGARIAAADPSLTTVNTTCGPPLSACFGAGNIFNETAVRLPAALLGPSTFITVIFPDPSTPTGCNKLVTVRAGGQYPFFFYKILRFVGINVSIPVIQREAKLRWEHQGACASF
jgi:hypothetical protein